MTITLGDPLGFDDVIAVARGADVEIGASVRDTMAPARRVIEVAVASDATMYGVTTGIGDLANVRIPADEATALQRDIVLSHATGVGVALDREVVRAMMLLKARTLVAGHSGVRFELVERIVEMLNHGIHPVVPSQGSLGASGDLAQLAHLALPIIGAGSVEVEGEVLTSGDALERHELAPISLLHKEGLSLVNGTEMMLAVGILTLVGAENLARTADVAGAMTLEACLGTDQAFAEELISLRPHKGSLEVAAQLRRLLTGSGIVASHRESEHIVQDAYSLRCIPQVHGAYRDGIAYVRSVLADELASVIDNPSVVNGEVRTSGNFHGESLGLALDHLALCITGFSTISERRVARLVDADLNNGLPAFLTKDPGRRSGFMLTQYTSAALVSESRSLCFPASADSIPSSAGQEDHVSMGATSARKAATILINSENAIAIELLAAAQGLDLRAPLEPGPATDRVRAAIREISPFLEEDRSLAPDIAAVAEALRAGAFV